MTQREKINIIYKTPIGWRGKIIPVKLKTDWKALGLERVA